MREEFKAITSGWMLVSGFDAITERLHEVAKWLNEGNAPLLPDEESVVALMVNCQIDRGLDERIC